MQVHLHLRDYGKQHSAYATEPKHRRRARSKAERLYAAGGLSVGAESASDRHGADVPADVSERREPCGGYVDPDYDYVAGGICYSNRAL